MVKKIGGECYTIKDRDSHNHIRLLGCGEGWYNVENFELVPNTINELTPFGHKQMIDHTLIEQNRQRELQEMQRIIKDLAQQHTLQKINESEDNTMNNPTTEPVKKASTALEQKALKAAKEEAIKLEVERKQVDYCGKMNSFLSRERMARQYRKEADDLRALLDITDKEMIELF